MIARPAPAPVPPAVPACCDGVYFCPTSNEDECAVHGGFDVCCAAPELHHPRVGGVGFCPSCRLFFDVVWPSPPYAVAHRSGDDGVVHWNPVSGTLVSSEGRTSR